MMNDYKMNFYVDYINRNVLNRINYARLQEDYQTEEKVYAKSVLNALHQGVMEVYGTETFDRAHWKRALSFCRECCSPGRAAMSVSPFWNWIYPHPGNTGERTI